MVKLIVGFVFLLVFNSGAYSQQYILGFGATQEQACLMSTRIFHDYFGAEADVLPCDLQACRVLLGGDYECTLSFSNL